MKRFAIIVCVDAEGGIARAGDLPWKIPADLAHFKQTTTATDDPEHINAVIMGRKTWDSIPARFRPLANRLNVVVSRQPRPQLPDEVIAARSLDQAIAATDRPEVARTFIVGGAEIYRAALAHPRRGDLYLTRLDRRFDCDTFFPPFADHYHQHETLATGSHEDVGFSIERWRPVC